VPEAKPPEDFLCSNGTLRLIAENLDDIITGFYMAAKEIGSGEVAVKIAGSEGVAEFFDPITDQAQQRYLPPFKGQDVNPKELESYNAESTRGKAPVQESDEMNWILESENKFLVSIFFDDTQMTVLYKEAMYH
jgi:hypothetical protein